MLILARKPGESIAIDNNIKIRVLEIKGGLVKLGIEAPNHVAVHREEVYERILEQNQKAALETSFDMVALASALKNTLGTSLPDKSQQPPGPGQDKDQK